MPTPPAPPPPPPLPMPGFGGPGPPPPPPPPAAPGGQSNATTSPGRPPIAVTKDRGALLTDITKGTKLKKAVTNDRSAPIVDKAPATSVGPPIGVTPNIPRPPGGLAPPIPSGGLNRGRSNSDISGGEPGGGGTGIPVGPQLGGIFAGVGIPKLRRTGVGIDTGADRDSSYLSDPESSRASVPKPPISSAPKPPIVPRPSGRRPTPQTTESSPPQPSNPLIANLRKTPQKSLQRPNSDIPMRSNKSSADITPPRAPPPLPGTSKPPPPPITSRKPSTAIPLPQPLPTIPARSIAPPPAPASAPRPPEPNPRPLSNLSRHPPSIAPLPLGAPPPPPIPAPRTPPSRSTPPPPPVNTTSFSHENSTPSLAMQAARNAFGNGPVSPALPPPPPPPISSPSTTKPSLPSNPPGWPSQSQLSKSVNQQPSRLLLESSSYTLSNGNIFQQNNNAAGESDFHGKFEVVHIEDNRWHFQDDSQLPKPREFVGGMKKYRAGRGSSVPLNLSNFRS